MNRSRAGVPAIWPGNDDAMVAGIGQGRNPSPLTLRVKPELLTVLRTAGLDLLGYDGVPCREVAGPLADAARRIDADPRLRSLLRPLGGDRDISADIVANLQRIADRCADRLPGVTFNVRALT